MAFVNHIPLSLSRPSRTVSQRRTPIHTAPRHVPARMTAASECECIETAWPAFAEKMRTTGEIPPLNEWHDLLDVGIKGGDETSKGIWVLNLMQDTGVKRSAVTYEKLLQLCADREDRAGAFLLIEHMFNDKILLGDIDLPDGMEAVLRKILPPEAFE